MVFVFVINLQGVDYKLQHILHLTAKVIPGINKVIPGIKVLSFVL